MAIAFFDLDRTLLEVNSGSLWARHEFRENRLSKRALAAVSGWLFLYHLGVSRRLEDILKRSIRTLEGEHESVIRERTLRFYEREVRDRYRPGVATALNRHREQGDRLVLLTTSSVYLSEPVAEELSLDAFICSRFEVGDDGRFTGESHDPLCVGGGKVVLAKAYASRDGIPLETCSFYSDSYTDLPMLEAVGTPVCVHPDRRLRRTAKQRGWPIVDWSAPR